MCAHIPGNSAERNELAPQTKDPLPRTPFPRHFCTHPLSQLNKPTVCKLHCDCPCLSGSLCTLSLIFFTGNKNSSEPILQQGPATFSHALKPLHVCWCHEALGAGPLRTNPTNFMPFGVWWLLQSRHLEQSVRKNCWRQMSAFPLVPFVTLRQAAQGSCWHDCLIDSLGVWVSPGAPVPGLAARAYWLFTLLLHHQIFPDPSLFKSHIFQLQQYIPFPKNTGKYICPLCRSSWVCLYSWVHVWRWGIELFTTCLRPWWLNWDLLLYLPGRRGSGGWGKV